MSGSGSSQRSAHPRRSLKAIAAEIDRQRKAGVALRDQLQWRVEALIAGGHDPNPGLAQNGDAFAEVWDAFTIPGTAIVKLEKTCEASVNPGLSLRIAGLLVAGQNVIGFLQRRFVFDRDLVIHEMLVIYELFRGRGINLAILTQSFDLYDELGLQEVYLQAGLATGRWHWARVGFEFARPADLKAVRDWATQVTAKTGVKGLRVDRYSTAAQFARMGGRRKLSLETIAQAFPKRRKRIEEAANGNGLQMADRIPLGRAVMITGPEWIGRLDLNGPGRTVFRVHAAAKANQLGAGP